jgi:CHAT domain-containing protein
MEIMQTWRLRADLVTLSACQTGITHVLRGDEPMGLVRAFLFAGARAVLVSQWKVEDAPTFLLMQRYYSGYIQAGSANLAAALHAAQVWLRSLTVAEARSHLAALPAPTTSVASFDSLDNLAPDTFPFAHPRHWAAFILVGA